jgi:hypothetical protein
MRSVNPGGLAKGHGRSNQLATASALICVAYRCDDIVDMAMHPAMANVKGGFHHVRNSGCKLYNSGYTMNVNKPRPYDDRFSSGAQNIAHIQAARHIESKE